MYSVVRVARELPCQQAAVVGDPGKAKLPVEFADLMKGGKPVLNNDPRALRVLLHCSAAVMGCVSAAAEAILTGTLTETLTGIALSAWLLIGTLNGTVLSIETGETATTSPGELTALLTALLMAQIFGRRSHCCL